jgi:hypothetical protein
MLLPLIGRVHLNLVPALATRSRLWETIAFAPQNGLSTTEKLGATTPQSTSVTPMRLAKSMTEG